MVMVISFVQQAFFECLLFASFQETNVGLMGVVPALVKLVLWTPGGTGHRPRSGQHGQSTTECEPRIQALFSWYSC